MSTRVRLLPVLMTAALLLFGLKAISIWTGMTDFVSGIGSAVAEEPARTHTAKADHDAHQEDHGDHASHGADETHKEEKHAANDDHHGDDAHHGETSQKPAKKAGQRQVDNRDSSFYSRSEIQVLEQLGSRRSQLDTRERELAMREQLLVAAEQRLEKKVVELKEIEARIQSLLIQKEEEDEEKLASLVKVYENMKAKDAARIFDRLEMDVLVPVAQRMKEQKIAAVLAKMDADAAQRLTVELAQIENSDTSIN